MMHKYAAPAINSTYTLSCVCADASYTPRGQVHFWTLFMGVNFTFFPMHMLGIAGYHIECATMLIAFMVGILDHSYEGCCAVNKGIQLKGCYQKTFYAWLLLIRNILCSSAANKV